MCIIHITRITAIEEEGNCPHNHERINIYKMHMVLLPYLTCFDIF